MADDGERRLAAILSADVAGYSKLMGDDERATVLTLTDYREVFGDHIARHKGRVIDSPGDNLLAEFASPVETVNAAIDIQHELGRRNRQLAEHRQMHFRIGLNLGDVIAKEDGTIYGDGVNVAARLEGLAEPGGICLSETVFLQTEGKVEAAFEDIGAHEVKNIAKPVRTYRVVTDAATLAAKRSTSTRTRAVVIPAAVVVLVVAGLAVWQYPRSPEQAAIKDNTVLALPTGPSIAVLPFVNMSGDPEQEYFADGITEEIIAALTQFSDLFVIARNSTFQFKGRSLDVRELGRELGARYIVEGSVRRSAETIRVTAQLLDARDGAHIWAETYERDLTASNIFAVQDEITDRIVATIGGGSGVISRTGIAAARTIPPEDLTDYECILRFQAYIRAISPQGHRQARNCLELVVEHTPENSRAWTALSTVYRHEHSFGFNTLPGSPDRAYEAAQKAIELDPASQGGYTSLALTQFQRHELQPAFIAAERALTLNPNSSQDLAVLGMHMAYAGEWARGIALTRKAMALNPHYDDWYYFPIFFGHFNNGDYEQALIYAQKINMPNFFWAYAGRAAVYGQLDRREEAERAVAEVLKLYPDFGAHARDELYKWNYAPDLVKRFLDGLRKAGLDISDEPTAAG